MLYFAFDFRLYLQELLFDIKSSVLFSNYSVMTINMNIFRFLYDWLGSKGEYVLQKMFLEKMSRKELISSWKGKWQWMFDGIPFLNHEHRFLAISISLIRK